MTKRIAVVGPGPMGLGITQVVAAAGIEVVLLGRDTASVLARFGRLAASVARQVARGRFDAAAADALLARVLPARSEDNDDALADCELAIESVAEDRAAKLAVLQRRQAGLPAGTLMAASMTITQRRAGSRGRALPASSRPPQKYHRRRNTCSNACAVPR